MTRLRVAVLFGGRSGEHEISLLSAAAILDGLTRAGYACTPVGIGLDGIWHRGAPWPRQSLAAILRHGPRLVLPPWPQKRPLFDVVFPALHGTFGEDGTVQGLLELAGIPYVGAGVLGAAAAMDKDVMKRLFQHAGLPVVPHLVVRRGDWRAHRAATLRAIAARLAPPWFTKPANLGSSVGISRVTRPARLAAAIDLAARYDAKIMVEHGVDARELECSVLGNDAPVASAPGEILPAAEFYSYAAKYQDTGSRTLIPAPLTARQVEQVRALAVRAYQAVDCTGLARVDFFLLRRGGRLLVNEINTLPGFTAISMYPKMWEASGLPLPSLLDRLVQLALERARDRAQNRYCR